MDQDFDAQNNFINHTHEWLYVDWALDLNGDTPSSRATTIIEYVRAYRAGAQLLRELGDTQNADHFAQRADELAQVQPGLAVCQRIVWPALADQRHGRHLRRRHA